MSLFRTRHKIVSQSRQRSSRRFSQKSRWSTRRWRFRSDFRNVVGGQVPGLTIQLPRFWPGPQRPQTRIGKFGESHEPTRTRKGLVVEDNNDRLGPALASVIGRRTRSDRVSATNKRAVHLLRPRSRRCNTNLYYSPCTLQTFDVTAGIISATCFPSGDGTA